MSVALCHCQRQKKKQATVEPFQPYKGFYTTAPIDRAPFSKGCLLFLPPFCRRKETEALLRDALTHKHEPQATRAQRLLQQSPIVRMTFSVTPAILQCPTGIFQQITCVSGLPLKSSESPSIRLFSITAQPQYSYSLLWPIYSTVPGSLHVHLHVLQIFSAYVCLSSNCIRGIQ